MGEAPDDLTAEAAADRALSAWMQELAPYGVFTTDSGLRIRSWNQWLAVHSGRPSREMIGRPLAEAFPDLEKRNLLQRYQRALDGEGSLLSAALHKYLLALPSVVPESGLPHMLQTVRIAPLPAGDKVGGTVTVIEDVTQREFHAQSLARRQELERLLSGALAVLLQSDDPATEMAGIFASIIPAVGVDMYVSYLISEDRQHLLLKASAGMLPRQRQAIEKLPILQAEQRQRVADGVVSIASHKEALAQLGVPNQQTFPLVVGDRFLGLVTFASYRQNRISALDVPILVRLVRYIAIALDRTARERDMASASRAKDDFLAALSHELRTPLNPVLLLASDALANPETSPEARDAFRVIEKNVLLEARLIDDLLDLTRIERGKLSLEANLIDIHAVVRDALVTVRAELNQKAIRLELALGAPISSVVGDAGRLQQVLWNVLRNAVKFTPPGGVITLSSRIEESTDVVIEVTDSGLGMEPHELSRIFTAFAQGDHASQAHRFGGLGLGLAISKRLVELHSGRIEATSRGRNQGSSFTISFPLAPGARATAEPRPSAGDPAAAGKTRPSGRILLIEDHVVTRNTLARLLTARGYIVAVAGSCAEARGQAVSQPVDLVLSDIGLPDGDGYQLMKELHASYGLKGIALTGYGMEADMARSQSAGFVAHLTKPISINLLEDALAAFFNAAEKKG